MILAVGLGNPGDRYVNTRHNVGFEALDRIAASARDTTLWRPRFDGRWAEAHWGETPVGLLKPQTFMNASGRSVRAAAEALGLRPENIVVLHDELDLPFGAVRLKLGGGDAGHRGIRSISQELESRDTVRLRLGIGRPPENFEGDIPDFVLEAFAPTERAELPQQLTRATEVFGLLVEEGLSAAMNIANQRPR